MGVLRSSTAVCFIFRQSHSRAPCWDEGRPRFCKFPSIDRLPHALAFPPPRSLSPCIFSSTSSTKSAFPPPFAPIPRAILIAASAATVNPMLSQRQIDANRRNAQFSTGPRTPEGRAAVGLNALRHGLSAQTSVLPGETRTSSRNSSTPARRAHRNSARRTTGHLRLAPAPLARPRNRSVQCPHVATASRRERPRSVFARLPL
jgi:hypothetical protein